MKKFGNPLLSLSAPLLICIAFTALLYRDNANKLYSLPPLFVGTGLIISGAVVRRRRRQQLLFSIRKTKEM